MAGVDSAPAAVEAGGMGGHLTGAEIGGMLVLVALVIWVLVEDRYF